MATPNVLTEPPDEETVLAMTDEERAAYNWYLTIEGQINRKREGEQNG